jgi:hypothetical protein
MLKKTLTAVSLACLTAMSGAAFAGDANDAVIDDDMSRRAPDSTSGSGHTVEANCFGATELGTLYGQEATATLEIEQNGSGSSVEIEVEDAIPNTHFTVWLRIKGGAGFNDAGSPWTGGGATPLCSGTEHADLNAYSPWNNAAGTTAPLCNSFYTDATGKAKFKTDVNFPVVGGAYPFQQAGGASSRPGHDGHADVPTAIVDPRTGNGGPFMIRVISHCTDQSNHGLSPAVREAWF